MKAIKRLSSLFLLIALLTGCGTSQQEAIQQAKVAAEDTFNAERLAPNETTNGISYYLPPELAVDSELENNIILTRGKKEYILFVNPLEDPTSEEIFDSLQNTDDTVLQSFAKEDRFGYISITPLKDKLFELIVGVGGVKFTTQTTAKEMAENSKLMMEVVNSVDYEDLTN